MVTDTVIATARRTSTTATEATTSQRAMERPREILIDQLMMIRQMNKKCSILPWLWYHGILLAGYTFTIYVIYPFSIPVYLPLPYVPSRTGGFFMLWRWFNSVRVSAMRVSRVSASGNWHLLSWYWSTIDILAALTSGEWMRGKCRTQWLTHSVP